MDSTNLVQVYISVIYRSWIVYRVRQKMISYWKHSLITYDQKDNTIQQGQPVGEALEDKFLYILLAVTSSLL